LFLALLFIFIQTISASGQPSNLPATSYQYSNPEPVVIQDYSGRQEDPVISPDGGYLFFDTHDDTGELSYLYYARRIDYKTFKFIGRIPGANYPGIEGVEDTAHNFYFVSPVFLAQGGVTIGHGIFSNGSVTNMAPVRGISPQPAPSGSRALNFDIYITPDGNTLYFSDFMIDANDARLSERGVKGAQLAIATRNADGSFTRLSNSGDILRNVNALGTLVYNATPSADGLALAVNASPAFPTPAHIYIATRSSPTVPFGVPRLVAAADLDHGQLSEPGSFSPDGKYLYFHRVLSPTTSQLYVLTRQ
jgi:Tol biopolymer transport system component